MINSIRKFQNHAFIIFLVIAGFYGLLIETIANLQPISLFIGFHFAALGAMLMVTVLLRKNIPSRPRFFVYVALQIFAFRIAYFPAVVLAAFVACHSEWLFLKLGITLPIKIFPAFFVSMCLIFAAISFLLYRSIQNGKLQIVLLILLGIPALLISLSSLADLTILPDDNWTQTQNGSNVTYPRANPYRVLPQQNLSRKFIAFAGGFLYPAIPDAPWSTAAKGTLEFAYRQNPNGSSHDRLRDHYLAFIAAFNIQYDTKD